jgi:hypothetical protein
MSTDVAQQVDTTVTPLGRLIPGARPSGPRPAPALAAQADRSGNADAPLAGQAGGAAEASGGNGAVPVPAGATGRRGSRTPAASPPPGSLAPGGTTPRHRATTSRHARNGQSRVCDTSSEPSAAPGRAAARYPVPVSSSSPAAHPAERAIRPATECGLAPRARASQPAYGAGLALRRGTTRGAATTGPPAAPSAPGPCHARSPALTTSSRRLTASAARSNVRTSAGQTARTPAPAQPGVRPPLQSHRNLRRAHGSGCSTRRRSC